MASSLMTDFCTIVLVLWVLEWARRRLFRYRGLFESQGIPVAKAYPWKLHEYVLV